MVKCSKCCQSLNDITKFPKLELIDFNVQEIDPSESLINNNIYYSYGLKNRFFSLYKTLPKEVMKIAKKEGKLGLDFKIGDLSYKYCGEKCYIEFLDLNGKIKDQMEKKEFKSYINNLQSSKNKQIEITKLHYIFPPFFADIQKVYGDKLVIDMSTRYAFNPPILYFDKCKAYGDGALFLNLRSNKSICSSNIKFALLSLIGELNA